MIDHSASKTIIEKENEMIARAKISVLASTKWFTSSEVLSCIPSHFIDPVLQLGEWKLEKKLFCIESSGNELYPEYAFDSQNDFQPISGLQAVLRVFGESKNGWDLAYWFAARNGLLDGKRPQDILQIFPACVLGAAMDHMSGIQHG